MSNVVVEFYRAENSGLALIRVRVEECHDEFEADALIEHDGHMYEVSKIIPET